MVIFSLLLEKCGDDYYYRYISESINYYIPSYKIERLNQPISNFESSEGYSYPNNIKSFLESVYNNEEFSTVITITDIQNKKNIDLLLNGYRYQNYIVIVGTQKIDTLLEETLFKEDYLFLVRWVDKKEDFVYDISDNVTNLLGYTKEEILSKPYIELIHPGDRTKFSQELLIHLQKNTTSFYQKYRLITKSKKVINILDHSCLILKEEGTSIVGYLRDITLEVEMSSKLKELTTLDEESFNSITFLKIEWDKEGKVTRWNKEATDILGWDNSSVIEKHISELNLLTNEDSTKFQGQITRLINQEVENIISTFKVIKKDGSLIDTKWSTRLISREGEPRILSTIIDQSQEALLTTRLDEMEERSDLLLKTLFNTNNVSNEVFGKLVTTPLTTNPEGLIKAEIIIRKLEEEITRINNALFYNNDNNLLNDVNFLKNEDIYIKERLLKLEEKTNKVSDQIDDFLNINLLNLFKTANFKNVFVGVVVFYVIFNQLIPGLYLGIIKPSVTQINKELKQVGVKD